MEAAVRQGAPPACGARGFRDHIRVVVRIRPTATPDADTASSSPSPVAFLSDVVLCAGLPARPAPPRRFPVDGVLGPGGDQADVYREVGARALALALDGFSASVLAYGPSGTGKTYTMMGTPDAPGLVPRLLKDLFASISPDGASCPTTPSAASAVEGRRGTFSVSMAYLEICNERARDLLDCPADQAGKGLGRTSTSEVKTFRLVNDPKHGPVLKGLTPRVVRTWRQALHFLERGQAQRTATEMAARSTFIVQLNVQREELLGSVCGKDIRRTHTSRVNLVELAGSERVRGRTEGSGSTEAPFLNKSMAVFGRVIAGLVGGQGHGPFRDSLVTQLLLPSLGGGTATTVLAAVSPAAADIEETLATLRTAGLARQVVNPVRGGPGLAAAIAAVQLELQLQRRSLAGVTAGPQAAAVAEGEALLAALQAQERQELEECQARRRQLEAERAALEQRQVQDTLRPEVAVGCGEPPGGDEGLGATDEALLDPRGDDTVEESEALAEAGTVPPSPSAAVEPQSLVDAEGSGQPLQLQPSHGPSSHWSGTFISPPTPCPGSPCPPTAAPDGGDAAAVSSPPAPRGPAGGAPPPRPQATHGGTVTAAEIGHPHPRLQGATVVGTAPPPPPPPPPPPSPGPPPPATEPAPSAWALDPRDSGRARFPHRSASQPRVERGASAAQRATTAPTQTPRTATPRTLPGDGAALRTPRPDAAAASPRVLRTIQPAASPAAATDASKYFHSKPTPAGGPPAGDMPRAQSMPALASPRPAVLYRPEEGPAAAAQWAPRPLSSRGQQPASGGGPEAVVAARPSARVLETPRVALISPRPAEDCRTPRVLGSARGVGMAHGSASFDLPGRSPDLRRAPGDGPGQSVRYVEDSWAVRSTAVPRSTGPGARDLAAKSPIQRKLSLPLAELVAERRPSNGSTTPRFHASRAGPPPPSASWRSRTSRQLSDLPVPAWLPFR